jgi:hypothetical protein
MKLTIHSLVASAWLAVSAPALAGQVPGAASDPDIPISHRDRVYSAEQFSNTVSVTDPLDNKLLGVIRLGDPLPASLSPLYRGQLRYTAWDSRPIIEPLRWLRSARMP